jgi:transposase
MSKKRRSFSDAERIKIGLEAIKETMTQSELASKFGVHPSQILTWKKRILEHIPSAFKADQKMARLLEEERKKTDNLYRKIGQLEVENDFLKKKSAEFGLLPSAID